MNLNKFLSGKSTLNEYIHRLNQNGASFQVHYWGVMQKHYDNLLHKHSFFEVCYVVEGEGIYIDDNHTYSLQENTLFLSKPEVLHQIKSEKGLFLLYVAFELIESESSEKWIRIMEIAKQCPVIVIQEKDDTPTTLLWKSLLIQASYRKHAFFEEMLSNIAYSLIISILQNFVPSLNHSNLENVPEVYSLLLTQAILYIHDNLASSLKLSEVAKHFHISGRHLSRIFVSELGVSYSKYVLDERIKKAVTLLKKSNLSIKEISEETGFISVQYFTRVFTSMMQISPARFRSLYVDSKTTEFSDN
ncbi:AraC family transcriptional regulator [Fodinisporobacter ferrooxydans]|uniref:AraC family transcriptional regulator n=1 Tax=Fodinisporobacter ferrooxydans TaxID=2901836 RepID=A0ABY4CN47_9BACL|nr:AraC family transcriptional regulator [Alicyclobacillaceae bacterium MYW30-H2]